MRYFSTVTLNAPFVETLREQIEIILVSDTWQFEGYQADKNESFLPASRQLKKDTWQIILNTEVGQLQLQSLRPNASIITQLSLS